MLSRKLIGWSLLAGFMFIWHGPLVAEKFIVKDGKANAEIVLPKEPNGFQKLAADELRDYIKKISGAELPIVSTVTDGVPIKLYVGESKYTKDLGITAKGLTNDSYHVKSGADFIAFVGNDKEKTFKGPVSNMFKRSKTDSVKAQSEWNELVGHKRWTLPARAMYKSYSKELKLRFSDHRGSLMAVYDFLRSLGVRWYFPGEFGECLDKMKSITLPEVNKTVKPQTASRKLTGAAYKFGKINRKQALWVLRLGLGGESYLGPGGSWHSVNYILHNDETRENHKDWYLLKKGVRQTKGRGAKPCLMSKGLKNDFIAFARKYFEVYGGTRLSVTPTDGYVYLCECPLCEGKKKPELGRKGMLSDYVWTFTNEVAKALYKDYPNHKVFTLAYGAHFVPPASIEIFHPNVHVEIKSPRRLYVDPEVRKKILQQRKDWLSKMTSKQPLSMGDNYTPIGKMPFPNFIPRIIAEDIKSLAGISYGEYIEENYLRPYDVRKKEPSLKLAVNHLNIYVTARLWWDATQDIEAMLDEYCKKFYGPAAEEMKEFLTYTEANILKFKNTKDVAIVDKTFELIEKAKKAASKDTIYWQRVDLIDRYLYRLRQLRRNLAMNRGKNGKIRIYTTMAVNFDGKLDDRLWKFGRGRRFKEADEKSWYRAGWTYKGGNLYFAVHCETPDMKSIAGVPIKNDDPAILKDERVEIVLETQNHSFYQIAVNPAGAVYDADWSEGKDPNPNWQSDAEVVIKKGDNFWNAEIMIPVAPEIQEEDLPLLMVSGRTPKTVDQSWFFNIARLKKGEEAKSEFYDPAKFKVFYIE